MSNYSRLGYCVKREIVNFSQKICKGMKKPEFKLIVNMLYGISESGSCHLSKISRALKEDIKIKKTIERLSRGLNDFSEANELLDNYADIVKEYVDDKTIFTIDNSDITKPYSNALEGLEFVRDGSTGEIEKGYWTLEIAALTGKCKAPVSVYDRVYSVAEDGFVSATEENLNGLRYLSERFGKDGVRALDRGFDGLKYYEYFLKEKENFIIRATKNRDVRYKGETLNILEVANQFKGKFKLMFQSKKGKTIDCKTTIIPVSLPKHPKKELNLVVVYGFGEDPMMLLTNLRSDDKRLANTVAKVYLMRWRIEEHFRFKKQQYHLEDFRVRSLNSIRTLHRIVAILSGFVSILSEKRDESVFVMELIEVSKRIYKPKKDKAITKFMNYAIADGIFAVLKKSFAGISHFIRPIPAPHFAQLCFSD